MQAFLIFFSSLIALCSPVIYIRSILKGETRPHRTTRFIILLGTLLATSSLIAQHNTVAVFLAGVSAIQAIAIFTLSLKKGMGGWSKLDILCLCIAISGIILWQTTKEPVVALYASILSDIVGMIPTLLKTYRLPHTENWVFFALDTIAATLNLLAVKVWTIHEISYPLYLVLINLTVVLLVLRPRFSKK